jgi:Prp8 binding protein
MKFSTCGDFLASAGYDKQIFLWDVFEEKCSNFLNLKGHTNAVLDLSWSCDSTRLYSCGADHTVNIWDLVEGKRIKKLKGHEGIVNGVSSVRRGAELVIESSDLLDCEWK